MQLKRKKKGKESTQNVNMLCIQTAHKRVRERSRGRQRCFQWFCSRVSWWLSSTLEGLLGSSDQEEEEEEDEEEVTDERIYN